jgi:phosphomannomutase/phosphoglucomutase
MTDINPHIFRANDIRGIVDKDLTPEVAETLGKGFGTYVRRKGGTTVFCGRDNRKTSPTYQSAFQKGMASTGCDLYDVGMVTTPVVYFALRQLQGHACAMITGSHNPPTMNGFKMCFGDRALAGEAIQEIKAIIDSSTYETGEGFIKVNNATDHYLAYLQQQFSFSKRWKVVIDAGNSIPGKVNLQGLIQLGINVVPLYCDLDPTFPHHFPDPVVPENLKDLIAQVHHYEADLGIGYDGDGDRLGVVDDKGIIRWGDQLMILFARDILKTNPGAKILCEVKCSQSLIDDVKAHGGIPIMCATGHSIVEETLIKEGALLAGEMSGHIFFKDRYFGYDDALYATLRLLEYLEKEGKPASEIFASIPQYVASPEIRIACADEKKFDVVASVKQDFKDQGYDMIEVDGARVLFEDGWGLLRASQTEPKLILRFEGKTKEAMDTIQNIFASTIKRVATIDIL